MPIAGAPNRGFADYQRQSPYDSGILYSATVNPLTFEQTPVIDVSRYAYLGGIDGVGGGDAYVTFVWSADANGAVVTGERRFVLTGAIGKGMAQYRLLNMGPFVQVSWNRISGAPIDQIVQLFGTNRYAPVEFIPVDAGIFAAQNKPIGVGVTDLLYPGTYYEGPLPVWFFAGGGAPWTVSLSKLSIAGAWQFVDQVAGLGAGGTRFALSVPAGAWRVEVLNGTGVASSYYLGATQTMTGAS